MAIQTFPISPAAVTVQVLSFLTLVLDIPSFVWHIKNRNISASLLVFWIILVNFFDLVNALLWPTDDVGNWWHGQIWCDIQVKLVIASNVAILGAIASTMRALAIALDTDRIVLSASTAQRRRNWIIDGLLCFGLPLYMIVIHYVVQPTRYYIFAIAGCTPSFDNSWPSIVIIYIWPPVICLLDAFYGGTYLIFAAIRYQTDTYQGLSLFVFENIARTFLPYSQHLTVDSPNLDSYVFSPWLSFSFSYVFRYSSTYSTSTLCIRSNHTAGMQSMDLSGGISFWCRPMEQWKLTDGFVLQAVSWSFLALDLVGMPKQCIDPGFSKSVLAEYFLDFIMIDYHHIHNRPPQPVTFHSAAKLASSSHRSCVTIDQ